MSTPKDSSRDAPPDGDYASWLEKRGGVPAAPAAPATPDPCAPLEYVPRKQTLDDVLVHGETPTEEFLKEFHEQNDTPVPSDEDMERQALEAGGEDGDPETPE
jgi:hypothetical protein